MHPLLSKLESAADLHGLFEGTGHGFIDWVWKAHEGMERHSHQITNVLIDVDVEAETAIRVNRQLGFPGAIHAVKVGG